MQIKPIARSIPMTRACTVLQRIVVVCDGTVSGDAAPSLADAISRSTSAIVRAVTWLPASVISAIHLLGSTPIETFLETVTRQLYRTTTRVGFWRLELLVGNPSRALARICREEEATLIIVPGQLCDAGAGPQLTLETELPVACVFDHVAEDEERVLLSAPSDPRSQRSARIAAAVIATLHPVGRYRSTHNSGRWRTLPPIHVDVRTVHASEQVTHPVA